MTTFQINDTAKIANKNYRVYNILNDYNGGLVCFGRIDKHGNDLSAMNPHNLMSLTFAQVEKFEKLGTIIRTTTAYTVEHKLCDGKPGSDVPEAIWDASFSFNAADEDDANRKANSWARYHSFDIRDVRVRLSTTHEAQYWLHNEWVN